MKTFGWKELTCIQLGGVLSLPLVMVGFTVGKIAPGLAGMALCVMGNGLLALFALISAPRIIAKRSVTSQNVEAFLGSSGKKILALFLALSMLFWFAIQTQVVVSGVLPSSLFFGCCLYGGGCALSLSSIYSIERYAKIVAPLMALFLAAALFHGGAIAPSVVNFSSFGKALSVIVGGSILAVIDLPTFFKEAHDVGAIKKTIVATFLVAMPLVECCGVALACKTQDVVSALSDSVFGRGVLIFLGVSGWMTNIANLYSAAKSIEVMNVCKGRCAYALAACIGIAFTLFPLVEYFADLITFLAMAGCAFGGLLLAEDCLGNKMPSKHVCWAILGIGLCVGVCNISSQKAFFGISILDVFAVVFFLAMLGSAFRRREIHEPT